MLAGLDKYPKSDYIRYSPISDTLFQEAYDV